MCRGIDHSEKLGRLFRHLLRQRGTHLGFYQCDIHRVDQAVSVHILRAVELGGVARVDEAQAGSSPVGSAPRKDNCYRFRVKFATTFFPSELAIIGRNLLSMFETAHAVIVGETKMRKIILEILDVITGHPKRRRSRDGTYFEPAPRRRASRL